MDTQQFEQQVADLASVLGDSTRRGVYITVREAAEPMTASQIASLFDIHANVARHHLDRLVADGYLRVTHRHRSDRRGPGAGRPAKYYEPTSKSVTVQFPERRYDLLAELLLQVIEQMAPETAPAIAEEIGRRYGSELAKEIGLPKHSGYDTAAKAVASALMGVGFDTSADTAEHRLVTRFCPFGDTATRHPAVVCSLDQGIVQGLLGRSQADAVVIVNPHVHPTDNCITQI